MALTPGMRLGPYEVLAAIGQGGMGEVYRARDTRLARDVALKILPDAFSSDPDRLARFEREAQVLASLSHPNIGAIHGLEESGDTKALVLELVEGPTLADRIVQGPIPVDEALSIARQIGDALEAAHNAGVIHRDLKPANIKLTPDGSVKVLDFGLAKAIDGAPAGGSSSFSLSPTITTPAMTQAGLILGTAAYMSPEQAKGKAVDKRADIWAFGVVLFEMLTGSRPFPGEDVSDVLASVLAREPQLAAIPNAVPSTVRLVLKACLQKDPKKRIHDMGDVRLAMTGVFETVREADAPAAIPRRSWLRALATAAVVVLVGVLAAGAVWFLKPTEPRSVIRFSHRLKDEVFSRTGRPVLALSRDGRRLAYVADARIYLRNLDEPDAKPISGTDENPSSPFFSPDGEWIGFWSSGEALKKIRLAGGTPVTLTKAGNPLGVSWGADDTIVYALPDGIWSVSGNGGAPEHLVKTMPRERIHGPQMLPGRRVLFASTNVEGAQGWDQGNIVVQALDTGQRTVLHTGGADPRYVPTGHLVYALINTLFAIPLDVNALAVRGGPIPVVAGVRRTVGADIGIAQYAISDAGVLAHITGGEVSQSNLSLADRSGVFKPFPGSTATIFHPRFSHDQSRIAVHRLDVSGNRDIWIYEVSQAQWRQLTFDGGDRPVWTPDGRAITYRKGTSLWQIPSDFSGAGAPLPGTDVPTNLGPFDWSPKRDVLLWGSNEGLHAYRVKAGVGDGVDSSPQPLKAPEGSTFIGRASFSPDGRWFVFVAVGPSGDHVYVSPFPFGNGGHRRIMNESGSSAVWSRSGGEIVLITTDGRFQALRISTNPAPDWGNPQALFSAPGIISSGSGSTNYDVTRDGRQLLIVTPTDAGSPVTTSEVQIVLNWHEELKRLAPIP